MRLQIDSSNNTKVLILSESAPGHRQMIKWQICALELDNTVVCGSCHILSLSRERGEFLGKVTKVRWWTEGPREVDDGVPKTARDGQA